MRSLILCSFLAACAGPSQGSLADTPTARTPRPAEEAPPASVDDKDRAQVNGQFEQMQDTQAARREASHSGAPAPGAGSAAPVVPGPNPPVKKGVAEQAPDPKQAPSK